ncbi:MAG TPA: exodeoxyribonuclease III [bacterium]|nr:exodeoxyribonuclease III [bacterium]HPQ66457.1 exodeoxyribonuclease III [bacterium]
MLVATFNVNSIRARLPTVLAWLEEHRPDVLALQETKVRDEDFPRAEFEKAGWQVAFRGEKTYNGVAIVSRETPELVSYGFDGEGKDEGSRLIRADFGGVSVVNTYVPQGRAPEHEMFRFKLEWLARLRRWFDRTFSPDRPLAWAGDFNVARLPLDVFDPEGEADNVCYHPRARDALENVIAWGFEDCFRSNHPEERLYTFFDYRTPWLLKRRMGWRIDYIMAAPALARRCRGSWIDLEPRLGERPSDHTFLLAEFE